MPTTPGPIPTDLPLLPEVDARVNPCPECEWGEVVMDGPMERDTGHQPYRCSVWCGWSA